MKNMLLQVRTNFSLALEELGQEHDCGLRALSTVLPELAINDIVAAFMHSCEWWPHRGVTNKEYNIALSYLNVKDKFEYVVPEGLTISDLQRDNLETYIVLLYGHYTVVCSGCVVDRFIQSDIFSSSEVVCYWRLV